MRVKAVLDTYFQSTKRGERLPDVPKILQPVIERYETSFKQQPQVYEAEYLDSLEAAVAVLSTVSVMTSASSSLSQASKPPGKTETEQKALTKSVPTLAKMTRGLMTTVNRTIATELRNKVAKGMFTENGAKRALALADGLVPQ